MVDTTRISLLERIKDRGDAAAWEAFDAIYRPMLARFAKARGLGPADVDDVVQDCMAALAGHIQSFEYDACKGQFRGWLRTLVNNRVRNRLRMRLEVHGQSGDFKVPQEREPDPEALFDRLWRQEHVRHCLGLIRAEMQDSTFQAFHAYVIQEQPLEEVCRALNMTPNQVNLIKWRVTNKLREKLIELVGEAA